MRNVGQSALLGAALALLIGLSLLHTCQLDRLEQRIRDLEVKGPTVSTSTQSAPKRDDAEAKALRDPRNLLRPRGRALVNARQVARGGTLRVEAGNDPKGLNVYLGSGADLVEYDRYFNARLAARKPGDLDTYTPELAISVSTPDQGLSYEVELRPGVKWQPAVVDLQSPRYAWLAHDHELSSRDFEFLFQLIGAPEVNGRITSLRTYFEALDRFEVIDAHRFRLVMKERLASTLPALLDLSPIPSWLFRYDEDGHEIPRAEWGKKLNEHWHAQRAIGVGPYRFQAWTPGVKLELVRNEQFFGERPAFDRVIIRVVKDQSSIPRLLKTGELDLVRLQPEQYKTEVLDRKGDILGEPRIHETRMPELGYFYLGWNEARPFFADKRVRQAMTLALDRESLVKNVFHGLGRVTTGPFGRQHPCYDPSIQPWPYDLTAAAQKLDEAGWKDSDGDGIRDREIDGKRVPLAFTLLIYGNSNEWETIASIYRESLAKIGVSMTPAALEWTTMLQRMDDREYDAFTGAWILTWDVDLAQTWHSKEADRPKSSNRIGYKSAAADELIDALRREQDDSKRNQLCHRFHALLHEDQPYTFIYQRERAVLYWDYLNEPEMTLVWPYRDLRYYSFREPRP
ncbi:MAG: ABC transporter substrate-binding protein [Myxococcota bacterium]